MKTNPLFTKYFQALFMKRGSPLVPENSLIQNEFAHVHGEKDGSLHLRLSDADAKTLLESGWGELHLLAGMFISSLNMNLPLGVVMVYAPRNMEEVAIVLSVVKASYDFARGAEPLKRYGALNT